MALRAVPIRRAGIRPNLFMGADREGLMFFGLLASALIFAAQEWRATAYGLVLWFGALYALRLAAKSDPHMRAIYRRNFLYRRYYPPHSTPFRDIT